MWDDVVIGSGDKGCSATKVFAIEGDHCVSENSVSYWVGRCYLGLGMTIFKNTEEGRKLAEMIAAKRSSGAIHTWLEGVLLSHVSKGRLKVAIAEALKKSYQDGMEAKAAQMRAVLGV